MRALIELLPVLALLYGTFLLGQVNQRRKHKEKRDVHPVVKAARTVVVAEQVGGPSVVTAIRGLEIALDEWDAKAP